MHGNPEYETYINLSKKYTKKILEQILSFFSEAEKDLSLIWIDWIFFKEDLVLEEVEEKDIEDIIRSIRYFSKHLPYSIENFQWKYWNFSTCCIKIFLTECYIQAIIEYSNQYSELMHNHTLKYFNDPKQYLEDFFCL